jgi:hypothetical protein
MRPARSSRARLRLGLWSWAAHVPKCRIPLLKDWRCFEGYRFSVP